MEVKSYKEMFCDKVINNGIQCYYICQNDLYPDDICNIIIYESYHDDMFYSIINDDFTKLSNIIVNPIVKESNFVYLMTLGLVDMKDKSYIIYNVAENYKSFSLHEKTKRSMSIISKTITEEYKDTVLFFFTEGNTDNYYKVIKYEDGDVEITFKKNINYYLCNIMIKEGKIEYNFIEPLPDFKANYHTIKCEGSVKHFITNASDRMRKVMLDKMLSLEEKYGSDLQGLIDMCNFDQKVI